VKERSSRKRKLESLNTHEHKHAAGSARTLEESGAGNDGIVAAGRKRAAARGGGPWAEGRGGGVGWHDRSGGSRCLRFKEKPARGIGRAR